MDRKTVCIGSLAFCLSAAVVAAKPPEVNDLVVHEWGTFLAMQGSDGVTLDGMYHEEHALPAFVHARSKDQLRMPSAIMKGETPVIYFYTKQARRVRVDVRFPRGVWTQWYPQAQVVAPSFAQASASPESGRGRIVWCADLIPAEGAPPAGVPECGPDALWNHARAVDAAYVRTKDRGRAEVDRFLFYRGLGDAALPLQMTSADGGSLRPAGRVPVPLRHVFVIRVEKGKAAYRYFPALPADGLSGVIPSMSDAVPLRDAEKRIGDDLTAKLAAEGLYEKEARAMVNTWRTSYFNTEGIRALFILPQEWTDRFIPLEITPRPVRTVRVMVGRVELLAPERERKAADSVAALASPEPDVRQQAFNHLRDQGRYVEPIIRRIARTTVDERVRTLCRRLLATDFVTELRAAVHSPADGSRDAGSLLEARAQLAAVLREIGLDEEARAEAVSAKVLLQARPHPRMENSDSRIDFRSDARIKEAMGDSRGAAEAYGKFIDFAAQVGRSGGCVGCHASFGNAGPNRPGWFRDWWVGPRFARHVSAASGLKRASVELEQARARDGRSRSIRMKLAYLYAAMGDQSRASQEWTAIDAAPESGVRAAARR